MIRLSDILESILGEEDSPATIQAHKLGLVSKPYGHWADPKTGQIVARTISGQLVKVTPKADPPRTDPQRNDREMASQQSHNQWNAAQPKQDTSAELEKWKQFYGTDDDEQVLNLHPELRGIHGN